MKQYGLAHAGRISTAYPMSEFDIIVNRAAKLPSPMEYYINDNAIRRSPSFRISTAKPPSYIDLAERLQTSSWALMLCVVLYDIVVYDM